MRPRYITATRSEICSTTREIVGHEQKSQVQFGAAGSSKQVDHLRLDRHVERRDRLVADDQFGLDGASARAMPMRWRWPPENSCG
jgi:hypothetical protein